MKERIKAAREARLLAYKNTTAVLSTISQKLQGMPFGSVSPVLLTDEGHVVFYVSDIAQHAKNLDMDSRLSITFFNPAAEGDQNEQGRLTLSGHAQRMSTESAQAISARYFRVFPDAKGYEQAHDFHFWKLQVEAIRFIGGFGEIFWLTPKEWLRERPQWSFEDETRMVEHMNEDHADANYLILKHYAFSAVSPTLAETEDVEMVAIYPDGCYFAAQRKLHFISFLDGLDIAPCDTAQEVRKVLVQLTHSARAA
ncbi:MAG: heme utilization protein HemS [Idiomarinaceae bacterium HL-53]|nr:MAG: heme utilization protein HemS [Idiomarinaceae bacterium HL-53]CUS48014.1 hypothetical protein Ga0003345_0953 [Idiomarinaceae bacterium HL-53]